jgi:hypothetical protein
MAESWDQVDWTALGAPEIPHLLQDLLRSDDNKTTNEARNKLEELIYPEFLWHNVEIVKRMKGSPLPRLIIPFLIETIAVEQEDRRKPGLLDFLVMLSSYPMYENAYAKSDPERTEYRAWAKKINDAVREGLPIYQKLLEVPDSRVREGAQELLERLEITKG